MTTGQEELLWRTAETSLPDSIRERLEARPMLSRMMQLLSQIRMILIISILLEVFTNLRQGRLVKKPQSKIYYTPFLLLMHQVSPPLAHISMVCRSGYLPGHLPQQSSLK